MKNKIKTILAASAVFFTTGAFSLHAQEPATTSKHGSDLELTQKLNNPIASLIILPVQMNLDFHAGDGGGWRSVNNVQPVIPFKLTDELTVITRTILPYIYQENSFFKGSGVQQGLSDTSISMFVTPAPKPGQPVWGIGPALLVPTATQDLLGTKQWGAGPAAIILKQSARWTYGALASQIWAYAGDKDREYQMNYHGTYLNVPIHGGVNILALQPFLSYVTPSLFTLTLTSETTVNWKAEPGQQWTVPIDGVISHVVPVGKIKMNLVGGVRWYAIRPDKSPTWGIRFVVAFVL